MKTQIATTIEQSKRLLEAGLDPGSADMMWVVPETLDSGDDDGENTQDPPASLKLQRYGRYCDTPAWSLSRLIDISRSYRADCNSEELIESLVKYLCAILIPCGDINEKYLKK